MEYEIDYEKLWKALRRSLEYQGEGRVCADIVVSDMERMIAEEQGQIANRKEWDRRLGGKQ